MKIGRRLAIKILNVSRFVLSRLEEAGPLEVPSSRTPLDAAMLTRLAALVSDVTANLNGYEHARAIERTEQFFWSFCDDYVELVKTRAYAEGEAGASARASLATTLDILLRLFAPFLPFATEEAWSWWHEGSIHSAPWPDVVELAGIEFVDPTLFDNVSAVLREIRRAKTVAKQSMRTPVESVVISGPEEVLAEIAKAREELSDAGTIGELVLRPADGPLGVNVTLGD